MSNNLTNWVFHSRRNLMLALGAGLVVALTLAILLLALQVGSSAPTRDAAGPTSTPVRSELIPPTPVPSESAPTGTQGSPLPIALEAADAFLKGDLERFSRVALPAAVDVVSATPEGNLGRLSVDGEPEVIDSSAAGTTVQVPTDGGPLQMLMQVVDGRWQVAGIRYFQDGTP